MTPLHLENDCTQAKLTTIHLQYDSSLAAEVFVVGSFNRWEPIPLKKIDGQWAVDLQLPPGHYEYQFLVDGEWIPDPAASHSVLNPFGGRNSLLHVADEKER